MSIVRVETTKHHGLIQRVKCCNRLTKVYLSEETQHCFGCNFDYNFDGKQTGYFGSGKTKEEYRESLRR